MKFLLQGNADLVTDALKSMVTQLAETTPKVIIALVLFFVGYIISKILAKVIKSSLQKVGIDKLADKLNEVDIVQKANMDIKFSDVLSKIVYYVLMLFFAIAATSVLGIPEISQLVSDIFAFIPNLIVALVVMVLGTLLADTLRKVVSTALSSLGVASHGIISSGLFYFVFINVVVLAMSQAKIDTQFLSQNISIIIAGIALAFAIGYGLASKDVMANMVASFYSKDQFQIGDKITIEGVTGVVSNITKNNMTIKTESGRVVFPLSKAVNQKIEFHD